METRMIALLVTIVGALIWVFTSGKLETAGFVLFVIGLFYFVGAINGYKLKIPGVQ